MVVFLGSPTLLSPDLPVRSYGSDEEFDVSAAIAMPIHRVLPKEINIIDIISSKATRMRWTRLKTKIYSGKNEDGGLKTSMRSDGSKTPMKSMPKTPRKRVASAG